MFPEAFRYLPGVTFLLVTVTLSGCASKSQTSRLLEKKFLKNQTAHELYETPFFPQEDYHCGPAALATVLVSNGVEITPEDLVEKVYLPERKGSLQIEIEAAARSYGMLSYRIKSELSNLLKEIEAGNPVLVMQNLGFSWYPRWHYAVVVGFDLKKEIVILRSGTYKRYETDLSLFEKTWQRSGFWGLVILPPEKLPKTAEYFNFLKAVNKLEESGNIKAALIGYKSAHSSWPEKELPLMGQGNVLYSLEQYEKAAESFSKLLKINPEAGKAWNNLAYSLLASECPALALRSVKRAINSDPKNKNFRESHVEISATISQTNHTDLGCRIEKKEILSLFDL